MPTDAQNQRRPFFTHKHDLRGIRDSRSSTKPHPGAVVALASPYLDHAGRQTLVQLLNDGLNAQALARALQNIVNDANEARNPTFGHIVEARAALALYREPDNAAADALTDAIPRPGGGKEPTT